MRLGRLAAVPHVIGTLWPKRGTLASVDPLALLLSTISEKLNDDQLHPLKMGRVLSSPGLWLLVEHLQCSTSACILRIWVSVLTPFCQCVLDSSFAEDLL